MISKVAFPSSGYYSSQRKHKQEGKSHHQILKEIFVQTGLRLVEMPIKICHSFNHSEIKVLSLTPAEVLSFYKTYNTKATLCNIGKLPSDLKDTCFKTLKAVKTVVQFCEEELRKQFENDSPADWEGIPLLVTQDNKLRRFSATSVVHLSSYHSLFPHFASKFAHVEVFKHFFFVRCDKGPLKVLELNDIAEMLEIEMSCFCTSNVDKPFVVWDEKQLETSNVLKLWECIRKCAEERNMKTFHVSCDDQMKHLAIFNKFCLIPSLMQNRKTLVALSHAFLVVDLHSFNEDLVKVFQVIGLPVFNIPHQISLLPIYPYDEISLIKCFVTPMSQPNKLLLALEELNNHRPITKDRLSENEAFTLLCYFSQNIASLKTVPRAAKTLRHLPLHLTVDGNLVSLYDHENYRVSDSIPGMEEWHRSQSVQFIQNNYRLNELYDFVQCKELSVGEVYCRFIFSFLVHTSESVRLEHMLFLRSWLNVIEVEGFLEALRDLPFMADERGHLRRANFFYDSGNELFQVMKEPFPPSPYDTADWKQFLIKAGLIVDITVELLIKYARSIAMEAEHERTKQTGRKSKQVVSNLLREQNVGKMSSLSHLKHIKFIEPCVVARELSDIYPQTGSGNTSLPYIEYNEAVPYKYRKLVWTNARLLPKWANPMNAHLLEEKLQKIVYDILNIQTLPKMVDVASHCKNICEVWSPNRHLSKIQNPTSEHLAAALEDIYKFLQHGGMKTSDVRDILSGQCCIYVEDGNRLVSPNQIVKELVEAQEIRPYLYRVPNDLGPYVKLFEYLGMSSTLKVDHFASVLQMIREESRGDIIHPNQRISTAKAIRGLYSYLEREQSDISLPELYLPTSDDNGGSHLVSSHSLVYIDQTNWKGRLSSFGKRYLENITAEDPFTLKRILQKLPSSMQVTMITDLVTEVLSPSCRDSECSHWIADMYNTKFTSDEFLHALLRWTKSKRPYSLEKRESSLSESAIQELKQLCSTITVLAVGKCVTHLESSDGEIPNSEGIVSCFTTKVRGRQRIYYSADSVLKDSLKCQIQKILVEMIYTTVGVNVYHIPFLDCPLGQESSILDDLRVPADDLSATSYLPKCGAFVPVCEHHLLRNDFTDFDVEEFVGYEIDDPADMSNPVPGDGDVEAVFIYAQIIEEIRTNDGGRFQQQYRIKIDEFNTKVVSYTDLYKFYHRDVYMESGAVCLYQQSPDEQQKAARPALKSLDETQDEITEILEEAWKLPKPQRDKVIKRLFLQWHPDKNIGNEEFCTEVFKYLKNEIQRLEQGRPREDRRRGSRSTYSGAYTSFFTFMHRRARTHRHHEQAYRQTFRSRGYHRRSGGGGGGGAQSSYSGHGRWRNYDYMPPSFAPTNPQRTESRRWMAQAEADLKAVQNDTENRCYEWACLKCFQAVEKALVSCQFFIDADKYEDLHHTQTANLRHLVARLGDNALATTVGKFHDLLGAHAAGGLCHPAMHYAPRTPHQFFTSHLAETALQQATEVVRLAHDFLKK